MDTIDTGRGNERNMRYMTTSMEAKKSPNPMIEACRSIINTNIS